MQSKDAIIIFLHAGWSLETSTFIANAQKEVQEK